MDLSHGIHCKGRVAIGVHKGCRQLTLGIEIYIKVQFVNLINVFSLCGL